MWMDMDKLPRTMAKLCLVVEVLLLVVLVPALVAGSEQTQWLGGVLIAGLLAAFCVREIRRDLRFLKEYRR
jgi:hypothetical protein